MSETLYSLILFAIVATVTPGGATTLATASGAQFGFRRSVPLMAGIAAALAALAAAAATGLAALLQTLPILELGMKLVGTSYLLWLAYRIARAGAPQSGGGGRTAPIGFSGGFALLMVNPKGWAMAFGAAASFAALAASPLDLALIMGSTFGLAAILSLALWCAGGVVLARTLRTEWQWRVLNGVLGLLLAASIVQLWLD